MSGTYRYLEPGRYRLQVDSGTGPAGIRRPDGRDVVVGVEGGRKVFSIKRPERVYYWWRGPAPARGVRLTPEHPHRSGPGPATGLDAAV